MSVVVVVEEEIVAAAGAEVEVVVAVPGTVAVSGFHRPIGGGDPWKDPSRSGPGGSF